MYTVQERVRSLNTQIIYLKDTTNVHLGSFVIAIHYSNESLQNMLGQAYIILALIPFDDRKVNLNHGNVQECTCEVSTNY